MIGPAKADDVISIDAQAVSRAVNLAIRFSQQLRHGWKRAHYAVIGLFLLAIGSAAHATSDISNTTIADLSISKAYGSFVFIKVAASPANPAACSTNGGWHFTLPLSTAADQQLYAMLLTAFASGTTVDMSGLGACNEHGAIESLRSLRVSH